MKSWHYPRKALADHILNGMQQQLIDRVALFAPRKRGKTQFIQRDIIPRCAGKVLPIYVDFWMNKDDPEDIFIRSALEAVESSKSNIQKILDKLTLQKISFSPSKGTFDIAMDERQSTTSNAVLFDVFKLLDNLDIGILLLLDEVQHLATSSDFGNFTAALRSFMVNRADDKVKGIFTGSSREGLNQVFKDSRAPFYNSSQIMDFPELGDDFVRHELDVFKSVTGGRELNAEDALSVLISMERSPEKFVELLKQMALGQVYDITKGARKYLSRPTEHEQIYAARAEEMLPIDLALVKVIALGRTKGLFSEAGIRVLTTLLDDSTVKVNRSAINNSMARLRQQNFVYSPKRGTWIIEDPEFGAYLLKN